MLNKTQYEKRILSEIRSLPESALPKMIRFISLIKNELMVEKEKLSVADEEICHERTRNLLAGSQTNWAQRIIADREDRI